MTEACPLPIPLPRRVVPSAARGHPSLASGALADADFLARITRFCGLLRDANAFEEQRIETSGDQIQDRRLAEIGGKGLFAKEIHEALLDGRVDFAVHSLKDLETEMPPGIVLACTLKREDARDCLLPGVAARANRPTPSPRCRRVP